MSKKVLVMIVTVMFVFAMTACGGAKLYGGYYSCEFPEGFTATDEYENNFERVMESDPNSEEVITVGVYSGSAEDEIVRSLEYWGDSHGRVDDVTYGGTTWKVETFSWGDDMESCTLYTDTEDGHYIEINFFLMAYDNPEVVAMMEGFTFEEGAYDKNYDFEIALMEQ